MNLSELRVLVVEDEYDSAKMVSKILTHSGIQIELANNGYECLNKLEAFDPTIVVMDLAMPEMNGWEALIQMRSNPATAHIPVIAITAFDSVDVAEDAYKAGFDGYFPKPVKPSFVKELVNILDSL
jgi:CheY-like chemotaxis protein